jgi:lipopolysaccharide export system permease protein
VTFDRYAVDINRFEQKAEQSMGLRPREWSTMELLDPPPEDPNYKANRQRFHAELHDRFTTPLYPIAFVLIAAAFAGQAQTTRQNRNSVLIAAFCVGVGVRVLGISAVNAANGKASAVPWLYAIPLAAIVLSALAIQWNMTPRRTPAAVRALGMRWRRLTGAVAGLVRRPQRPTSRTQGAR